MTYLRAQIEQCPGFGWQGGPEFKTLIVSMLNGRERRNGEWQYARHSYSMPFLNITKEGYRNVKQMHYVCRGRLHCFQFKDELDSTADNEIFDTGNGVKTVFQLRKFSEVDGVVYDRNVYIVEPGVVITDNGTPVSPTVDYDRGTVTFVTPPISGHVLRWTGSFLVWVRFNQDNLPFSIDNGNGVGAQYINGTIDLIEVPPPTEEE